MRYIVIGAGAIGGTIGGRLFASGHEVVLIARGAHLDALRSRGLRLATPDGTSTLDIPAIGSPGELALRQDDVLILATKTQDAEPVLAEWAWQPVRGVTVPHGTAPDETVAADTLPVVCAQNGVASERIALRRFRRVYGMCVWLPATHLANLSNATEAVCGHDAWLHATELRRRVTAEGRAVLDAAGIGYARERESAELRADQVQVVPVNGAERVGGSSWQSLTRGTGSIEADFLNGEIVLLGREHGVPTPLNEVLQRLANQAARDHRAPGSSTPDEVMALAALPAGAG